jgi:hypothetical protein
MIAQTPPYRFLVGHSTTCAENPSENRALPSQKPPNSQIALQFSGGPQQFSGGPQQFSGGPPPKKQQFTGGPQQFSGGPQQFTGGPGRQDQPKTPFNPLKIKEKINLPPRHERHDRKYLKTLRKRGLAQGCVTCVKKMRPLGPNTPTSLSARLSKVTALLADFTRSSAATMLPILLVAAVNGDPALAWSTNGNFARNGSKSTSGNWTLPTGRWNREQTFVLHSPAKESTKVRTAVYQMRTERLLSLIASVEAPTMQYNAVHHSARNRPPALPTQMTIAQIRKWIEKTPGQQHAIGRYQIIPSTLSALAAKHQIAPNRVFDKSLQDLFALSLLADAEYADFLSGKLQHEKFMDNLAKIWAAFPLSNGKSAYDGVAGNKAQISRQEFERKLRKIYP